MLESWPDVQQRGYMPRCVEFDENMTFIDNISEGLVVKRKYLAIWVEIFRRYDSLGSFPLLLLLLHLELYFRLGCGGNDWINDGVLSSLGQCRRGGWLRVFGKIRGEQVVGACLAVCL